jgi:hypothetical protein
MVLNQGRISLRQGERTSSVNDMSSSGLGPSPETWFRKGIAGPFPAYGLKESNITMSMTVVEACHVLTLIAYPPSLSYLPPQSPTRHSTHPQPTN